MRSQLLRFGLRNRHVDRTNSYSYTYYPPISPWQTSEIGTSVDRLEKLKKLCHQNQSILQALIEQSPQKPQTKVPSPILLIPLTFLALSFGLSAHTPYSHGNLRNALFLDRRPMDHSSSKKPPQTNSQSILQTLQEVRLQGLMSQATHQSPLLQETSPSAGVFIMPVVGFPIISSFGQRVHPLFGEPRMHNGIDIATPIGTPIKSASSGYVVFSGWNGGYGNMVVIRHRNGYETLYAHLDKLQVTAGNFVKQSDVIGLSGSTGYVTGPHLHFEIRINEVAQNPLKYLQARFSL